MNSFSSSDEELERLRRRARCWKGVCIGITVLCFFPVLAGVDWVVREKESQIAMRVIQDAAVSGVLTLIVFALLWNLVVDKKYKRFNESFKLKHVFQWISGFPGLQEIYYDMRWGFSHREIRNAAVVGCGDEEEFSSRDLLRGVYGGAPFRLSNVTTRRVMITSKGRRRTETIFTGQVLEFSGLPGERVSEGHLQIFQKEFLSDIRGWRAEYTVKTGQEAFDKRFYVYASNERSARAVLTRQMTERILAFADAVGKQVAVTFRGRELFVAVYNTRSIFDGDLRMPVEEQKRQVLEDLEILQKAWRFLGVG